MPPRDVESRQSLAESLLRKVHEQSRKSPEPAPFWREGRLRCEFHKSDDPPRLKVFQGDVCVHEEVVQGRGAADDRSRQLKQAFVEKPEGREDRRRGE